MLIWILFFIINSTGNVLLLPISYCSSFLSILNNSYSYSYIYILICTLVVFTSICCFNFMILIYCVAYFAWLWMLTFYVRIAWFYLHVVYKIISLGFTIGCKIWYKSSFIYFQAIKIHSLWLEYQLDCFVICREHFHCSIFAFYSCVIQFFRDILRINALKKNLLFRSGLCIEILTVLLSFINSTAATEIHMKFSYYFIVMI